MRNATVVVQKVAGHPDRAVEAMFDAFDEARAKLRQCRTVFIKVNTVYFHAQSPLSPFTFFQCAFAAGNPKKEGK